MLLTGHADHGKGLAVILCITAVEGLLVNPDWGTKRVCPSCDARFYDMKREPIVCPKCQTTLDLNAAAKPKRSKPAPAPAKPAPPPAVVEAVSDEVAAAAADPVAEDAEAEAIKEDGAPVEAASDDEDEDDVMEDVSDLGKDEDDMAEVMEHVEDKESER